MDVKYEINSATLQSIADAIRNHSPYGFSDVMTPLDMATKFDEYLSIYEQQASQGVISYISEAEQAVALAQECKFKLAHFINGIADSYNFDILAPEVSKIRDGLFYCYSNLTGVTGSNISMIGSSAFHYCNNLRAVNFPNATKVGYHAFESCTALQNVSFPSLTNIQDRAFYSCSNLLKVDAPLLSSLGSYAFAYCSKLTEANYSQLSEVHDYAFYYCPQLSKVNFDNLVQVDQSAFGGCINLEESYLEDDIEKPNFPNLKTILSYGFSNTKIKKVNHTVFPSLTTIGYGAFANCRYLTEVDLSFSIGSGIFSYCSNLSKVILSSIYSLTIGSYAFYSCSNLNTVDIYSCASIQYGAFQYCSRLQSFYIRSIAASTTWYLPKINSNVFSSNYIGNLSIFVPSSIVSVLKTYSNWVSLSEHIFAIQEE